MHINRVLRYNEKYHLQNEEPRCRIYEYCRTTAWVPNFKENETKQEKNGGRG